MSRLRFRVLRKGARSRQFHRPRTKGTNEPGEMKGSMTKSISVFTITVETEIRGQQQDCLKNEASDFEYVVGKLRFVDVAGSVLAASQSSACSDITETALQSNGKVQIFFICKHPDKFGVFCCGLCCMQIATWRN